MKVDPTDYDILRWKWLPVRHFGIHSRNLIYLPFVSAVVLTGRLFLYCLFFVCMVSRAGFVDAHELADGFVEKAVEVVVRDENVKIRYFIGVNENTEADLKSKWVAQMSSEKGQSSSQDFESILCQQVKMGIKVKRQGEPVELGDGKVYPSPKHHFAYLVEFTFKLPMGELSELEMEDGSFQEMDSAARYSFKAIGSTMLVKSNVAPIIIRAQRHELKQLEERRRSEICKILATVATDIGDSD